MERAKAYKIPFSTEKVIFPTSVISECLISKVGLQRRAAAAGMQWIIHQGIAAADQQSSRKLSDAESHHIYGQVPSGDTDSAAVPIFIIS